MCFKVIEKPEINQKCLNLVNSAAACDSCPWRLLVLDAAAK